MNIFDTICLVILAFFAIIFAIKGLKKIVFTILSISIATFVSRLVGGKLGVSLLPKLINNTNLNEATLEKINTSLASVIGTVVAFIICFIIVRLIFKIVEFKIGTSVKSRILNHLLGAILGLIMGVGFVFVFSIAIDVVEIAVTFVDPDSSLLEKISTAKILTFNRNLN